MNSKTEPKPDQMYNNAVSLIKRGVLPKPPGWDVVSDNTRRELCSTGGLTSLNLIPSRIYGTYIGGAIAIHNFMYARGLVEEDKDKADVTFRANLMLVLTDAVRRSWWKTFLMPMMQGRAESYYNMAVQFGGPAFWLGK